MIAAGLMRAVARRPIWPLAIAGMAAAPMFLAAPVLAAPVLAGTALAGTALAGSAASTQVTNCGGGVSAVTVRPAAGFRPLTATPAQLTANGLPLRPKGRTELAAWRKFVTGGVRAARTTCGFAPVTPSSAPQSIVGDVKPDQSIVGDAKPATSQSIVGDAKPGSSQSIVGDAKPASSQSDRGRRYARELPVDRRRRNPGPRHPDAPGHRATAQPGRQPGHRRDPDRRLRHLAGHPAQERSGRRRVLVGRHRAGRAGNPLIQAGSAAGGYFGPYLWWRMVPQRPNEQRISLDTAAGDTVYVRIQLRSAAATVTIRDENTGAGGTYRLRY